LIRHQVFISSTYIDLKNERSAVVEAVLKMGNIPVGMELFVAASEAQFEYIKRVIDDSDYYVLIIGNRYGSVAADGISYTEKEFDYAVEKGIPILAFVHSNPDGFTVDKSDSSTKLKKALATFRAKVMNERMVSHFDWDSPDKLAGAVVLALLNAVKIHPRVGWKRVSAYDDMELLEQINTLRIESDKLKAELNIKNDELVLFMNNLAGAFAHVFNKVKAINKLRIYGITSATLQPKLLDFPDLIINECVVLLKKLPDNEGLLNEAYEKTKNAAIARWKELLNNGRVNKLTIVEYDKYPDMWYFICDESHMLSDIFVMNDNDTPYDIQRNRAAKLITSCTELGHAYIMRHINQFDNYVAYYSNKLKPVFEASRD